jgi:uncharacterized protein (DUF3820 family)
MTAEEIKKFANLSMPFGKYVDQKVLTVLKKDKASLEKMSKTLLPFQEKLARFLASPINRTLQLNNKKVLKGKKKP